MPALPAVCHFNIGVENVIKTLFRLVQFLSIFSLFLTPAFPQSLADFEKKVTEFKLDNGVQFILVERHEAPVVSFFTYANVGSVDEVTGISGMAHLFEHMAFKGTTTIGTKNITKELEALDKEDEAFVKLRNEKVKGRLSSPELVAKYQEDFTKADEETKQWVESNEFADVIKRAGGVGMNANTQSDSTRFYYSLPSNKMELWFSLESDRFLNPVLREFYTEKDVVMEERRMRVESNPIGKLVEELLATSFKAHPYGVPGLGWMSDLQNISRPEAVEFFKKYYGPEDLTIAIVGDVDPAQAKQLAQTYFGRIPASPSPEPVHTVEPEQTGERRVVLEDKSQPVFVVAYHKGDIFDPDQEPFEVMADIIGRGRASRLYTDLVKTKKIAISTSGFPDFPGEKYPSLMLFYAFPAAGHTNEECETAILEEIEKLKTDLVSDDELKKAKTRSRADLIRSLASNAGIGEEVASYQALTGDWRNLFRSLDKIDAVTAQDIQRVAKKYLTESNRTVASIKTVQ